MLVVHALWTAQPFQAIENPRQRPAYLYSSRYGPVPPAFTRGVRVGRRLLASGTASVVGEDSMHEGNLVAQFEESCRNLATLAEAGGFRDHWNDVCVYVKHSADLDAVERLAASRFGERLSRVVHAAICRHELLLEIEGICEDVA
jgi:chorismate lyase/3-hydroxybenzoate synthase